MAAFNLGTLSAEITIGTRGVLTAQSVVQNFARNSMQALNQLNATIMETNTLLNGMKTGMMGNAAVQKQMVPAMQTVEKAASSSVRSLSSFGDTITRVSMGLRSFGWLATTVFTAPILMAGSSLIRLGMDFEFTLAKMTGLANVAKKDIGTVTDELLRMTKATATGPQELADTMYFVASSGIKGAEALKVTKLAALGAASGMGDATDVANLLTSALNAFRATGLTASHMMDVLTATIREGKGEPAEMVRSFGSVMLMAAEAGIKVEDLAGSFALLTLTTNSAANSATYLRQLLMTILKPTPGEEDIMSKMNTSSAELQKIFREGGIMAGLMKMRELTKQYGESMTELFPNLRAFLAMTGLTGQNLAYNQEVMKKFVDVQGNFEDHLKTMSQTMKFQWNAELEPAKANLTILGEEITRAVLPILKNLVDKLGDLVKWYTSLSDAQKTNILRMAEWLAIIGPLSLIIATFGTALGTIWGWFSRLGTAVGGLNVVLKASPWFLLAGAIIGVVGWMREQTREAERATTQNNLLNTSLVKINGELKHLSELGTTDFTSMTQGELLKNNTWYRQMVDYYDKEVVRLYGLAGVSEADYRKAKKIKDEMGLPTSETGQTAKDRRWAESTLNIGGWNPLPGIQLPKIFGTDWRGSVERTNQSMEDFKKLVQESSAAYGELYRQNQQMSTVKPFEPMSSISKEKIDAATEALIALDEAWLAIDRDSFKKKYGKEMGPFNAASIFAMPKATVSMPSPAQFMPSVTGAFSETASILKELGTELGFIKTKEDALNDPLVKRKDLYHDIQARINAESKALDDLLRSTETGPTITDAIRDQIKALKDLQAEYDRTEQKKMVFSTLAQAATDLSFQLGAVFGGVAEGMAGIVDIILKAAEQIIGALLAVAYAKYIEDSSKYPFPISLAIAAIAIGAAAVLWNKAKSSANNAARMAEGGIIPSGYPHDTYPALLTSGEIVTPPGKLNNVNQGMEERLVAVVTGDQLNFILTRRNRKINSYS